jgi:hypothetical protein
MANETGTNHMVFPDGRIIDVTLFDDGSQAAVTTFPVSAGFDGRTFPEAIYPPTPEPAP